MHSKYSQAEVLPLIEAYKVKAGDSAEFAVNRFALAWGSWLAKVRLCAFKTSRSSGFYANMGFDINSSAATALCLAHVREFVGSHLNEFKMLRRRTKKFCIASRQRIWMSSNCYHPQLTTRARRRFNWTILSFARRRTETTGTWSQAQHS
jgi:hypothetical protein